MEYKMTESKTPSTTSKVSEPTSKVSSTSQTTETSSADKHDTTPKNSKTIGAKPTGSVPKNAKSVPSTDAPSKLSKLAVVAIILALTVPAGHFYWQQLQHQQLKQSLQLSLEQTLSEKITKENNDTLNRYNTEIQQALTNQEQAFVKKIQQVTAQIQQSSQSKIAELTASVEHLEQGIKQRQPSDWLLHEAEYLIRISARTLWLEHDTRAAIGLLKDADARLTELNDPAYLPVRETIQQDINALSLMPTLETDDVIITLMALNKEVSKLPLAMVDLGPEEAQADINLSDDINDWQANLAKTWQKFLNDFIRVRQRTGTVEALISPDQQENLKHNLSLKVQLAIWSATERKGELYSQSLADIQQWLNEFFDMENNANQLFYNTIAALQSKQVTYDYPSELSSLTAIRTTLRNQQSKQQQPSNVEIKAPEKIATPPTESESNEPVTQAPKSEGNI